MAIGISFNDNGDGSATFTLTHSNYSPPRAAHIYVDDVLKNSFLVQNSPTELTKTLSFLGMSENATYNVYWEVDTDQISGIVDETSSTIECEVTSYPTKASNPTPANNTKNVDDDLLNFTWETDEGDESKIYFYIGDEWVHQGDTEELTWLADDFNLQYSEVYYWRVDTYNSDTGLTTTGDTWTLYTEPNPFITSPPRFDDYNSEQIYGYVDDEWQWNDIEDAGDLQFAIAGGGRYKKQLIVVGHRKIYFGDL